MYNIVPISPEGYGVLKYITIPSPPFLPPHPISPMMPSKTGLTRALWMNGPIISLRVPI